jgi:hypothetical protein
MIIVKNFDKKDFLPDVCPISRLLHYITQFRCSCLCFAFFLHDFLDTLVQSNGDFGFRDAESGFWRDIDGSVGTDWGVFTTETSDTKTVWFQDGDSFFVGATFGQVGDLDVDGSSHTGTHVGWARSDDTEVSGFGASTWDEIFDFVDGGLESVKDVVDFQGFFHGHDSEVIFFTDPDDETFVFGDVATSSVWPVGGDTGINQERVGGHIFEHDVGFDEFLVFGFVDVVFVAWGQGEVVTTEFWLGNQSIEDWGHGEFHVFPVFFGHSAGQWEFFQVPGGSDSHGEWFRDTESGDIQDTVSWEAFFAFQFPVVAVFFLVKVDFVVSSESFLEEVVEVIVVGWAHGVAAHFGAWVTDTGCHDFKESSLVGFAQGVEFGFIETGDGDVAWVGFLDGEDFLDGISVCHVCFCRVFSLYDRTRCGIVILLGF